MITSKKIREIAAAMEADCSHMDEEQACIELVKRCVATELNTAISIEREACAKLADHTFYVDLGSQPHLRGIRRNFADAIRARGNMKGEVK